jgi:hypothetical protein
MRLVRDLEIFEAKDMPDWVQALETENLEDRNSAFGVLGLKMPSFRPAESASKLVLCRWPGDSRIGWDWDFQPADQPEERPPDSCAVIYFAESKLSPGEKREPGFTYGLGR